MSSVLSVWLNSFWTMVKPHFQWTSTSQDQDPGSPTSAFRPPAVAAMEGFGGIHGCHVSYKLQIITDTENCTTKQAKWSMRFRLRPLLSWRIGKMLARSLWDLKRANINIPTRLLPVFGAAWEERAYFIWYWYIYIIIYICVCKYLLSGENVCSWEDPASACLRVQSNYFFRVARLDNWVSGSNSAMKRNPPAVFSTSKARCREYRHVPTGFASDHIHMFV